MPTYDYHCPANDRVVEVKHRMSEEVTTWGQLCKMASIDTGDTPLDSPVERMISGGNIVSSGTMGSGAEPACPTGGCCPGKMCGM